MSVEPVKIILCAHTGSGKSGANASLAAAGYKLRYLDLDNGSDILRNLLFDPESPYVKANKEVGKNLESRLNGVMLISSHSKKVLSSSRWANT